MQKSSETRSKSRNGRSGKSSSSTPKLEYPYLLESPMRLPSSSPTSEKLFAVEKEGSPKFGFLITAPKATSIVMKHPNSKKHIESVVAPISDFNSVTEPTIKRESPKKKMEIRTAIDNYASEPLPAESTATEKATPKQSGKIGYPLKAVISLGISPKKKAKPVISDDSCPNVISDFEFDQ